MQAYLRRYLYMNHDTFVKAKNIYKKIEDLQNLSGLAGKAYKRFGLSKKVFWMSDWDKTEVGLCDEGLVEVIEEYYNKRIAELEEELKRL